MRKSCLKALAGVLGLGLILSTGASAKDVSTNDAHNLNRAVYHQLIMLPQLSIFDDLSFTVDNGNVTLRGQVRNAVLKDEATAVLKNVTGVESVSNKIEILPASFNDDLIRREMARAIYRDNQLFRYSLGSNPSIHIIVENGHVSLKGLVDNQTDKNVAGIRANGVPGVFSVENDLQVEAN